MEKYFSLFSRRFGKTEEMLKAFASELENGGTILFACSNELRVNGYIKMLKDRFDIDCVAEPNYTHTPMKVIFDPYDFSAEPAIIGIDYGTKKLFGYNLKKKTI